MENTTAKAISDRLYSLFPIEPVPSGSASDLSDSCMEDSIQEMEAFVGKRWDEIDRDVMSVHFEAPCSFTPSAFHYYLPAIILASISDDTGGHPEACELIVDYVLGMLRTDGPPDLKLWRCERWEMFDSAQTELVGDWLQWLRDNKAYLYECEGLDNALRVLRKA